MLDFRIDTFLTVCRHMNFTKAARELNITQPAVSHHIHYLEEQYGNRLFAYSGKKIRLTEAGKILLSASTTMKNDEVHLKKVMKTHSEMGHQLTFGATMTIGEYKMPEALMRYLGEYPDSRIQMVVADTKELLDKLNGGEIEFAVVEGVFQKKEYDYLIYGSEPFAAVCAPDYSFQKEMHSIEDLLLERLFIREPGSGTRYVLERYLEGKNLFLEDFKHLVEISNIGAIKQMVINGAGITFVYESAVEKELKEGILQKIELEDFLLIHDFTFLWRKGSIYKSYYEEIFHVFFKEDQGGNKEKQ